MAVDVKAEERLVSLIVGLLSSERGLTKQEILGSVAGYRDSDASPDSLDKMFERDKSELRELGIVVETLGDPLDPDDNRATRYRITRAGYVLPEDAEFDPEELALLGLAATVWQESSLSEESRRARMKVAGLGIAPADPIIGFLPIVRAADAALDGLRKAIEDRVIVEFDYLKPAEAAPRRRTVSPLALVNHERRWLLVAAEPDGTRKQFLLRRIVGKVRRTSLDALLPTPNEEQQALAGLDEFRASNTGLVHVVPGSEAEVLLGNRRDTVATAPGTLQVHWTDLALFADDLVALHPGAIVVEPPELVRAVTARLAAILDAHAGAGEGGGHG